MLCRCYFLSYSSSFLKIVWSKRGLGNYKSDLHQIFRDGRHVGVDVHSGIDFRIGQGTLPWQPILGAKSAEIGEIAFLLGTRIPQRMAGWKSGLAR